MLWVFIIMATGNSMNIGAATSGNVMVSQGAGLPPTYVSPTTLGACVLINTFTASNSPTIDITSCITASYDSYRIIVSNLLPASNGVTLKMQYSTDNGVTWDTTAGHYIYSFYDYNFALSFTSLVESASDTSFQLIQRVANTATSGFVMDVKPSVFATPITYQGQFNDNINGRSYIEGSGARTFNATINAIRFIMSSGNISTGTFKVYGNAS